MKENNRPTLCLDKTENLQLKYLDSSPSKSPVKSKFENVDANLPLKKKKVSSTEESICASVDPNLSLNEPKTN